ncbi:hypothetical protein M5689_000929 [Euphorbia peplus]|nr:hypothetical protein M5689_000929 [Euphorbia peplus]
MKEIAAQYEPDYSGGPRVFVGAPRGPYIVDLEKYTCTCRRWQLTRLPCAHDISSIQGNNQQVKQFVPSCYYVSTYKERGRKKTARSYDLKLGTKDL